MRKVHGLVGSAMGVLAIIAQHAAAPWLHRSPNVADQATIAPYLLPSDGPETDVLRQLIASRDRAPTGFVQGSNTTISRSLSESVTASDSWTAVVTRGSG